jgi:hypothetical protein
MKTQDLPKMLPNRTEIYLFVHEDTLIMQMGTERAGEIKSQTLTNAICENYLGPKPVSPATRKSVMQEMEKLKATNNKH